MSKPTNLPIVSPEQIAADALNEQGYLLQHKLVNTLLADQQIKKFKYNWQLEATELPVALSTGEETRIDIVLRLGPEREAPVRAVIECKRSARDYKRWIFFAQNKIALNPSPDYYYAEKAQLGTGSWNHQGEPVIHHSVDMKPVSEECSVFDFGIEARLNHKGHEKKVSATEAIEDAFQQVSLAQAGLGAYLRKEHILNFRILPVVATTAELSSAHFDTAHVSQNRGMIEAKDVHLTPQKWLGVNFRIREAITSTIPSGYHNKIGLAGNLALRQVRTIFVMQAEHLHEFLVWLETTFPKAA